MQVNGKRRAMLAAIVATLGAANATGGDQTVGILRRDAGAEPGYTLLAPHTDTTYLVDSDGRVVHTWTGLADPGRMAYLLDDGRLLRTARGGRVQLADWDGNVLWDYTINDALRVQHHDVKALPGGNVLLIVAEIRSAAEAIQAGRDPARLSGDQLFPESILEVRPDGPTGATVVWEWHAWDHLVQDFDPGKDNHGPVADRPERIDINFLGSARFGLADWLHFNTVAHHPDLDQIVVSSRQLDEIWVIDHSTTTAEARGSSGGRGGRGGDLLYRWGNPAAYRAGGAADHQLFGQHDPQWIAPGLPGAGNLLLFNNGNGRPAGAYSSVDELVLPADGQGGYVLVPGLPYGPAAPDWSYAAPSPGDLYSAYISGAERLAGGNTVLCHGMHGTVQEVTAGGDLVWEYVNPVAESGLVTQGDPVPQLQPGWWGNNVFKVRRYRPDHPGLAGRDLTPGGPIEPYRLLRNDEVRGLDPPSPPLAGVFTGQGDNSLDPVDDRYLDRIAVGATDPDASVCEETRPLVFYQLRASPYPLRLVKGSPCAVVVFY